MLQRAEMLMLEQKEEVGKLEVERKDPQVLMASFYPAFGLNSLRLGAVEPLNWDEKKECRVELMTKEEPK